MVNLGSAVSWICNDRARGSGKLSKLVLAPNHRHVNVLACRQPGCQRPESFLGIMKVVEFLGWKGPG